jgi:hypothetical protein
LNISVSGCSARARTFHKFAVCLPMAALARFACRSSLCCECWGFVLQPPSHRVYRRHGSHMFRRHKGASVLQSPLTWTSPAVVEGIRGTGRLDLRLILQDCAILSCFQNKTAGCKCSYTHTYTEKNTATTTATQDRVYV